MRNWNLVLSGEGLEVVETETTSGKPGQVFCGLEAAIEAMRARGLRRKPEAKKVKTFREIETMISEQEE
jgi:hypothetical protein